MRSFAKGKKLWPAAWDDLIALERYGADRVFEVLGRRQAEGPWNGS